MHTATLVHVVDALDNLRKMARRLRLWKSKLWHAVAQSTQGASRTEL